MEVVVVVVVGVAVVVVVVRGASPVVVVVVVGAIVVVVVVVVLDVLVVVVLQTGQVLLQVDGLSTTSVDVIPNPSTIVPAIAQMYVGVDSNIRFVKEAEAPLQFVYVVVFVFDGSPSLNTA